MKILPNFVHSSVINISCQKTNTLRHSLILKSSPNLFMMQELTATVSSISRCYTQQLVDHEPQDYVHLHGICTEFLNLHLSWSWIFQRERFRKTHSFSLEHHKDILKAVTLDAMLSLTVSLYIYIYSWHINVMIQSQEWDESSAKQIKANRYLRPHAGRSW